MYHHKLKINHTFLPIKDLFYYVHQIIVITNDTEETLTGLRQHYPFLWNSDDEGKTHSIGL